MTERHCACLPDSGSTRCLMPVTLEAWEFLACPTASCSPAVVKSHPVPRLSRKTILGRLTLVEICLNVWVRPGEIPLDASRAITGKHVGIKAFTLNGFDFFPSFCYLHSGDGRPKTEKAAPQFVEHCNRRMIVIKQLTCITH
jgi:hypothetical protein